MAYEETRTKAVVGRCPACKAPLEVVVAISLAPIVLDSSKADGAVNVEGAVVGAKTIEHDCLPRPTQRAATRAAGCFS